MPEVSVLMSVRNGEAYLREAVESILAQTFEDFEFIIIDNHSSDRTREILETYRDPRIVITRPPRPESIAGALNHGGGKVTTDLVARMDADDIALPNRLEAQLDFLRKHPEVGILGTQVEPIDSKGAALPSELLRKPETHEEIAWSLVFGCPLWHPTVMVRKSVLESLDWYGSPAIEGREQFSGEDYDLWCRAVTKTQIRNLPEILLWYRLHENALSQDQEKRKAHCENLIRIHHDHFKALFHEEIDPSVSAGLLGVSFLLVGDQPACPDALTKMTAMLIRWAKKRGTRGSSLKRLRGRLIKALDTAIWERGFNIQRQCLKIAKSDWQVGVGVWRLAWRRFL
jgi:glycosyltransferase involved in cell wall biosynthesis